MPAVGRELVDVLCVFDKEIRKYRIGNRFPPPWSVEELEACYVVRDHGGRGVDSP